MLTRSTSIHLDSFRSRKERVDGPFGFGDRYLYLFRFNKDLEPLSILATPSILKAVDESGKVITLEVAFTSRITWCLDFYISQADTSDAY
jgi:hypothetical protein